MTPGTGVAPSARRSSTRLLPPKRPSSARGSSSSLQQKLNAALATAERTAADLLVSQSTEASSFRSAGPRATTTLATAPAAADELDRSISRYRNDAAMVSFSEHATTPPFTYTSHFMPGIHFYAFLAGRGPNGTQSPRKTAATATAAAADDGEQRTAAATEQHALPASAKCGTGHHPHGLRMAIPETIVYGETGRGVWLYTDDDGVVQRRTEFTDKMVLEAFEADPVIVCKEAVTVPRRDPHGGDEGRPEFLYQGTLLRLLTPGELKTLLSNVTSTKSTKAFALQRYTRCNSSKAFVVRGVFDAGRPHYAWMINNTTPIQDPTPPTSQVLAALGQESGGGGGGSSSSSGGRSTSVLLGATPLPPDATTTVDSTTASTTTSTTTPVVPLVQRLCTSVQVDKTCTFIKLNERGCAVVSELNQRLVKHLEARLHLQLQTLIADYVKDTTGTWRLLQVKHFRVRPRKPQTSDRAHALPMRLRLQYIGYRDLSVLEEAHDSDDEQRHADAPHQRTGPTQSSSSSSTLHAPRDVRKLSLCKCCLAAYPPAELAFKMTMKMINEMLTRLRARLPPDKTLTFLTAAMAREAPDPSLAYESWSVCSYCYAIYERDQQLQRVEARFAQVLGTPDATVAAAGLGKLDDRAQVVDPGSSATVLPPQLTLCRLMLVISGIHDIPPELYAAERGPAGATTGASRLYLRISALGYTECIPIDPADILPTDERAPRGARAPARRSSTASTVSSVLDDDDDGDEVVDDNGAGPEAERRRSMATSRSRSQNYWLPLQLIRTVNLFAPRTPLHAKLKDTSGLMPFLNEDNSFSIHLIRATEPPLQDPAAAAAAMTATSGGHLATASRTMATPTTTLGAAHGGPHNGRARRAALTPTPQAATTHHHSVVLGATKLRMAQFRSAYVTKIDFYACMALTGDMFNLKGNIGLERVRYVDTRLLTAQHRLRAFNGVYIPDASYIPSDPLTPEWMDCLGATAHPRGSPHSPMTKALETPAAPHARGHTPEQQCGRRRGPGSHQHPPAVASLHATATAIDATTRPPRAMGASASMTSLGDDAMDEELEDMIERVSANERSLSPPQKKKTASPGAASAAHGPTSHHPSPSTPTAAAAAAAVVPGTVDVAALKQSLLPVTRTPSRVDSQMSMLLAKTIVSPRSMPRSPREPAPLHSQLWALVLQLNHAHNLVSRERAFCRWECYYGLFGQRRSAVERPPPPTPLPSASSSQPQLSSEVQFNCTHKFFVTASDELLATHLQAHRFVSLFLRNDVYASTRAQPPGEFTCVLDLAALPQTRAFDAALDIHPVAGAGPAGEGSATPLTPREAAALASSPPFLSVSVQLTPLPAIDPAAAVARGDFVVVGGTSDGLHVLKKIM